jgi:hypothetical protein
MCGICWPTTLGKKNNGHREIEMRKIKQRTADHCLCQLNGMFLAWLEWSVVFHVLKLVKLKPVVYYFKRYQNYRHIIEYPTFDSQMKETMNLKAKSFDSSQFLLIEKFIKQVSNHNQVNCSSTMNIKIFT